MKTFKTAKGTELALLNLRGKDYLPVAQRVVWCREEHPTWMIWTSMMEHTKDYSLFRAEIRDDQGRVLSTSHQDCYASDFEDHLGKAETSAIGRALALVGYGTQFCADDLDEGGRISDAPQGGPSPAYRISSAKPASTDGKRLPQGTPTVYRIPFGKYSKLGLHEVPRQELADYCDYLERTAAQAGKPMKLDAVEFVEKARGFLQMAQAEDPGVLDFNQTP